MPTPDEMSQRLDKQDEMLKKILTGMAEHSEYHKLTDPGVSEVIDILKGAKGAKVALSWLAGIGIAGASLLAWISDHVRLLK